MCVGTELVGVGVVCLVNRCLGREPKNIRYYGRWMSKFSSEFLLQAFHVALKDKDINNVGRGQFDAPEVGRVNGDEFTVAPAYQSRDPYEIWIDFVADAANSLGGGSPH